jgi:hypothetical protein
MADYALVHAFKGIGKRSSQHAAAPEACSHCAGWQQHVLLTAGGPSDAQLPFDNWYIWLRRSSRTKLLQALTEMKNVGISNEVACPCLSYMISPNE